MENNKCEAGCKIYTGGEIKHHKDCFYYPDSMSKTFDDMKAELKKFRVADVSVSLLSDSDMCNCCEHPQKYCVCSNER